MPVEELHLRSGKILKIGASDFGRPKGSITLTSDYSTTTISDFDTAFGQLAEQVLEDLSVSASWKAQLVIGDAGYAAALAAHKSGALVNLTVGSTASGGTGTWSETFKGYIKTFTRTLQQSGAAEVDVTFVATEVVGTP